MADYDALHDLFERAVFIGEMDADKTWTYRQPVMKPYRGKMFTKRRRLKTRHFWDQLFRALGLSNS